MPQPLIERYRDRLSLEPGDPVVTLNEGSTPLIHSPRLSERIGAEIYLKFEGSNPTGSFKDRGMTVAVSRAKGAGAEAVICASTGNTAASAAAYAARAGLRGAVIVPEGKIAIGKLAQALICGARVIALRGNFDRALELVRELADRGVRRLDVAAAEGAQVHHADGVTARPHHGEAVDLTVRSEPESGYGVSDCGWWRVEEIPSTCGYSRWCSAWSPAPGWPLNSRPWP